MALIPLLALATHAGSIEIALRASSTTAALGQPVAVEAVAALPAGTKLVLDLQRSTTDAFAIAKADDLGIAQNGDARAQKFSLSILPLALGKLPIELYWNIESPSGNSQLAEPSRVVLDVVGPELQGAQPSPIDIKEPRTARLALWPWLLAALIGAGLWELYRRRRNAVALADTAPPPDNRPAEVIALSELDALETSPLWPKGLYKEFYFELTEVVRRYLERRFGMPATKLTTSELYRQVREAELDRPLTALFKDIFDRADLVKFAKVKPESDWGAKDIAGARSLVEQTTSKDLVAPGAEGGKR